MDVSNESKPPTEIGPFDNVLIDMVGADKEVLRQSPPRDLANVRSLGWLMLATLTYQTGLFSLIGHTLFGKPGHIEPVIILGALAIATFIMLIDSYVVFRCGWHVEGLRELARGGVDIAGGAMARIKGGLFLLIRVFGLSVGLAQLTALFVSLIVFGTDIHARIEAKYLQANAPLIAHVTAFVDADIQRKTEAVTTEAAPVAALSGQVESLRQNVVDPTASDHTVKEAEQEVEQLLNQKAKAEDDLRAAETFAANEYGGIKGAPGNSGKTGYGLRWQAAMEQVAKAKARLQELEKSLNDARERLDALRKQDASANDTLMQRSQGQLPAFEESLKGETDKLEKLKGELDDAIDGREVAIRNAVEATPGHVSWDDGFLSQLRTLEQIAAEDQKIKLVIILIDIVSFGLELAAVSAKVLGYAPTTFAALQTREIYMSAVRIADEMVTELNAREGRDPELPLGHFSPIVPSVGPDIETEPAKNADNTVQQPPKRKRGRPAGSKDRQPRKHPLLPAVTGANGSTKSGPQEGPPPPA